jgi:3'-phosphoadenosine 5'-phosphosulfate sulfotransferase (PAPS reductase)/FAD synthetase
MKRDELLERIGDRIVVASMSSGKDSGAMGLHLRELGIPFRPVFIDTGWESSKTYDYLRGPLTDHFGEIAEIRAEVELDDEVELELPCVPDLLGKQVATREELAQVLEEELGHYSAMVRLCIRKGMFPSRVQRFCTQVLKVYTMRDYLLELDQEPVNAVGIRNEESEARRNMGTWEFMETYDCDVWRPIRTWTEDEVIAIHNRNGLLPNPHYLRGSSRVGCWPCIYARKSELGVLAKDESRIRLLELLERLVGDLAEWRSKVAGTTLEERGHHRPTWFQSRKDERKSVSCEDCRGSGKREGLGEVSGLFGAMVELVDCETCKGTGKVRTKHSGGMWSIREAVAYGVGDQREGLFASSFRDQGCMRWGLCEHEAARKA